MIIKITINKEEIRILLEDVRHLNSEEEGKLFLNLARALASCDEAIEKELKKQAITL